MNNHFGFAFTPKELCFAYFIVENDSLVLDRVGSFPYDDPYHEKSFFSENNISNLCRLLEKKFPGISFSQTDISVSVESNLALLKRVMYPQKLDDTGKKEHINWDLAESLTLPLSQYFIFRSPNKYTYKNFEEELVIAIPYKVLTFFKTLTSALSARLVNLSVHQLASEILIQNSLEGQPEKLLLLQKISNNHVETTFLWKGTYFTSHFDKINFLTDTPLYIDLIKSKISYIENLFEQYEEKDTMVDRILLYGDYLDDSTLEKIQKNMSVPVDRTNVFDNVNFSQNLKNTPIPDEDKCKYVECLGITLDI
jgi:Tfp pilus assembly PilM family ATPase